MQRAAWPLAPPLAVEIVRDAFGIRVERKHAAQVEALVDRADPVLVDVDELARAQPTRGHAPLQLGDRRAGNVAIAIVMVVTL